LRRSKLAETFQYRRSSSLVRAKARTYLGGEVKNPEKNIPRVIGFSVLIVAVLYLLMSVMIIGTIPWRDAAVSHAAVSEFIGKLYG